MPAASPDGGASLRSACCSYEEDDVPTGNSLEDEVDDDTSWPDEVDDADLAQTGMPAREDLGYAVVSFWRKDKSDGTSDWSISIESAPTSDWLPDQTEMPKLHCHYVDFGGGGVRRLKANRIIPRIKAGELSTSFLTNVEAWAGKDVDQLMGPIGNSRFTDRKRRMDESTKKRRYFDDQFASLAVNEMTNMPTRLMLWLNDKTPIVISNIKIMPPKQQYGRKPKNAPPVAMAWFDPYGLAAHIRHDKKEAERLARENAKLTEYHPRNAMMQAIELRLAARDDEIARLQDTVANLSRMVETLINQLPKKDFD